MNNEKTKNEAQPTIQVSNAVMHEFGSWNDNKTIKLMPCPFCGGKPELQHIGNNYTKKRSIRIKCKQCRCERTDAALRHDFDWLENMAAENWNQRPSACIVRRIIEGTWPSDCIQRAFVEGASWWQFKHNGSTMFSSERREAEKEAVRRYGEPSA